MSEEKYRTRNTLIKKIKDQQDEKSWNDFVFYYKNYLYVVIKNMNINHHDVEDILQKVILKVWKALPNFNFDPNKGKFRSWLCTITKNTVITFINQKKQQLKKIERAKSEKTIQYLNRIVLPEIESIAEKEWKIHVSNLAWENIQPFFSPKTLQCFLMFAEKDKSVATIAKELEIEENSVYVYKKRVQEKLLKEIRYLEEELG